MARATAATVGQAVPYLRAAPERVSAWLPPRQEGVRRVGLVWEAASGGPAARGRSVPLELLRPLLVTPGVQWVSLQYRAPAARRTVFSPVEVAHVAPHLNTFADVADVVSALDLVVTVDTATAHVAGALGVPTWVLVPRPTDWRWGRVGDRTPWYPSARLFRQWRVGEWQPVLAELRRDLERS